MVRPEAGEGNRAQTRKGLKCTWRSLDIILKAMSKLCGFEIRAMVRIPF